MLFYCDLQSDFLETCIGKTYFSILVFSVPDISQVLCTERNLTGDFNVAFKMVTYVIKSVILTSNLKLCTLGLL